jgi:probable HAF family extracellular repeat protein
MMDLGTLGGTYSAAYGISDCGQIVGAAYISGDTTYHAFLYEHGVMKDINPTGWYKTEARGINDNGQIAGFGFNPQGQYHGFILTPSECQQGSGSGDHRGNQNCEQDSRLD